MADLWQEVIENLCKMTMKTLRKSELVVDWVNVYLVTI